MHFYERYRECLICSSACYTYRLFFTNMFQKIFGEN